MAKGKRGGDFSKFANKNQDGGGTTVVDVPDEDEADGEEPTDVVPSVELPVQIPDAGDGTAGRESPAGAYRRITEESMRATTAVEQEAILAKLNPGIKDRDCDPAIHYKRALTSGREIPQFKPRADAPPLSIKSKDLFERIIAGGLLVPGAYTVYNLVVDHLTELITDLSEKPDAEPRS